MTVGSLQQSTADPQAGVQVEGFLATDVTAGYAILDAPHHGSDCGVVGKHFFKLPDITSEQIWVAWLLPPYDNEAEHGNDETHGTSMGVTGLALCESGVLSR